VLYQQHTGELMVSILLLQDILAIIVLFFLRAISDHHFSLTDLAYILGAFPFLIVVAVAGERFILTKLFVRFKKIHEYTFILSIGWCLCLAEVSHFLGLPEEIGAFIAGIVLASNPVSLYIARKLRPLRDFFLVLFFFAMGAVFEFDYLPGVLLPAITLTCLIVITKPFIFQFLLQKAGESKATSKEVGVRLGQASEFSLLIIFLALQSKFVSPAVDYLIQATTIMTFVASCYWVTQHYRTPLASINRLRRE
jgi:Kef-type K+ transport system membrane component KefB